jgi:hypothetical protein
MIISFIINIIHAMILDFGNETISQFFQEETFEYDIYEMNNKDFLIYFQNPCKNNVSLIPDNWDEIVKKYY